MKSKLIVANWKMNTTLSDAIDLCDAITQNAYLNNLAIASPTPYLAHLSYLYPSLSFAAQDVSIFYGFGAHTGECSSAMLASARIEYAIIGHSERRAIGEKDEDVRRKMLNCISEQIIPIICIGEPLEIRQNQQHIDYLESQLSNLPLDDHRVIIAYEPIWSIGTGKIPTNSELLEVFEFLDQYVNTNVAEKKILLYGGSVNSDNANFILSHQQIGGLLVGKASLDFTSLVELLNINIG